MNADNWSNNREITTRLDYSVSTAIISIVLILVIAGAAISAIIILNPQHTSTKSTTTITTHQDNVTVFGLVSTLGLGTRPAAMVFINSNDGQKFTAPISNNSYSIELPNHQTYNVSLRWSGNYTWQNGEVQEGQLPVNMTTGSIMSLPYNLAELTPNSILNVSGSLSWQVVTSSPTSIKFSASDGEQFIANVSQEGTFSVNLPNMMTYTVNIGATNSTGAVDWYYAHELLVSAPAKVVGLMVDVSL